MAMIKAHSHSLYVCVCVCVRTSQKNYIIWQNLIEQKSKVVANDTNFLMALRAIILLLTSTTSHDHMLYCSVNIITNVRILMK